MADGKRGDVISVVQRRRRWTMEQKLALVEEAMRPGSSVAGVADRHGMSCSLLFEWRRQVREATITGVVRIDREVSPTLVPVRVVEDPLRPKPTASPVRPVRSVTTVEVVLRNARVLRVSEAIPPQVLGRLAAALDV